MTTAKKVLVTGASGYLGRVLLDRLVETDWVDEIVGMDRVAPATPVVGVEYVQADMLSEEWPRHIEGFRPHALVHLAFVVAPMQDRERMQLINVEGTRSTVAAALAAGTGHILHASSATAYGALADNPVPLAESSPLRANLNSYQYARDKYEVELMLQEMARDNPDCTMSVIRPVIVYGPTVDNFLSRFVYAFPVVPVLTGPEAPVQFVHEDDVAAVMVRILEREAPGPFNLAGSDWLTFREVCRLAGRPTFTVPRWLLEPLIELLWAIQWPSLETPASIIDFIEHPWVVSTDRVTEELGYAMKHSSRDAVQEMVESRGDP